MVVKAIGSGVLKPTKMPTAVVSIRKITLSRFVFILAILLFNMNPVFADGVGFTAPGPVVLRDAKPIAVGSNRDEMWSASQAAIYESDFGRLTKLFSDCAEKGDPMCQYLLAAGVAVWHARIDGKPVPAKFGYGFARRWLRAAFMNEETRWLVAAEWRVAYLNAALGFVKDEELANCWGAASNKDDFVFVVQKCRDLEKSRYPEAEWLNQ
jgi:hypothetical protein